MNLKAILRTKFRKKSPKYQGESVSKGLGCEAEFAMSFRFDRIFGVFL